MLIILLVFASGGAALWAGQKYSEDRCRKAASFINQARGPALKWLSAAYQDRFLAQVLRQGPTFAALVDLRDKAAIFHQDLFLWHSFPESGEAFHALAKSDPKEQEKFKTALFRVASLAVPPICSSMEFLLPSGLLAEGEAYWRSRQNEVRLARLSFAQDQGIYCHAESLTAQLKELLLATGKNCDGGVKKLATMKKNACDKAKSQLSQEITDIENRKIFNLEKLKRKWPEKILAGLECS
jgi:hypothetical protein